MVWADPARDLALELPLQEQQSIFEKIRLLKHFPTCIPTTRVAVFAVIVFFRRVTGSHSIRSCKLQFISAVSGRRAP